MNRHWRLFGFTIFYIKLNINVSTSFFVEMFHKRDGSLEMPQNRDRSLEMSQNRDRSLEMSQNRDRSLEMSQNMDRSLEMSQNRDRSIEMSQNRDRSLEMSQNRDRSLEMSQNRDRSLEMSHNRDRSLEMPQNRERSGSREKRKKRSKHKVRDITRSSSSEVYDSELVNVPTGKGTPLFTLSITVNDTDTDKMGSEPNGNLHWCLTKCSMNTPHNCAQDIFIRLCIDFGVGHKTIFLCINFSVGQCESTIDCNKNGKQYTIEIKPKIVLKGKI